MLTDPKMEEMPNQEMKIMKLLNPKNEKIRAKIKKMLSEEKTKNPEDVKTTRENL